MKGTSSVELIPKGMLHGAHAYSDVRPTNWPGGERPVWELGRVWTDINGVRYRAGELCGRHGWGSEFDGKGRKVWNVED